MAVANRMGRANLREVVSMCTESRSIVGLTCRNSLVLVTLHAMVVMWWMEKILEVQSLERVRILYYVVVLRSVWLYFVIVRS